MAVEEAGGSVNLVITNVPGPQFPMYLAGAEMVETYPVPPLLPGFSLSVGVTSYDGAVYYGISADRDALPDIEVLGQCVRESLDELVDSASDSRLRAPRGRKRTPDPGAARMTVRIYVPATLTLLGQYAADGGVGPAPVRARAVTAWLREAWPEGDEEEWEYAALMAAADDSAGLLTADDPPRRVVLAVDVDSAVERDDSSLVEVDSAFPFSLSRRCTPTARTSRRGVRPGRAGRPRLVRRPGDPGPARLSARNLPIASHGWVCPTRI